MNDESGYIQFLAEARSGGQAALGRLAVLVWERLYPFVFRTTLNRDATEDVLQETLLTMLSQLGALRDCQRFWPWIYRVAWSKVQDRVRDRRLRSLHETGVWEQGEAAAHRSGDSDPLEAQIHEEILQQISAALARLDRQQRDILRLRCYDGLPYTKIATLTCTTPDRARVRFHRAKRSLRARLACCT